jgi:Lrp/AsnC family leucine-responsive transcriptional regulator
MIELDAIDRKILNLLQSDGRMTNADLAERIHLSPSACLRRVRRLEDEGVIDGYVMLVAQSAIGKPASIFVEITLSGQNEETLQAFETAVAACPDIMECHLMSGDADYLLRVVAADTADYERVHKILARLPGLARARSSFVLRTVSKRTAFDL